MTSAPSPSPIDQRTTTPRLLLLSLAAGSLDALSYVRLGHVFVAFMTGNTVLLGISLGQLDTPHAIRAATTLLGFCAGVALGAVVTAPGGPRPTRWPARLTAVIAIETALLTTAALLWTLATPDRIPVPTLLVTLALAAGLQSVGVQRLGIPFVSTTFITGTLTSAVSRLVMLLLPGATTGGARPSRRGLALPIAVFVVYGAGAAVGGLGSLRVGAHVIWVPVAAAALVLCVDVAIMVADRRRAA